MIRVNTVSTTKEVTTVDKKRSQRNLQIVVEDGKVYLGPVGAIFDRKYVMRDKNRAYLTSKLTTNFGELLNISTLLSKIKTYPYYSYFTKDMIIKLLEENGISSQIINYEPETYTCAREHVIDFGFNTMNFCIDNHDDIWVYYKEYEEQKQFRSIINKLSHDQFKEFMLVYPKMVRYIRYVNTNNQDNLKGFALKSINVSKLYKWLDEVHVLHNINYVSDIYNECTRIMAFEQNDIEYFNVEVNVRNESLHIENNYKEYKCI